MYPSKNVSDDALQSFDESGQSSTVPKTKTKISRNLWLDHLNLMDDGISDPPGIRVRPIEGLEAVNYLDPSPLVKVSILI